MRNVQETFGRIIEDVPYLPEELQLAVANLDDPSALAHLIAGALRIPAEEKQALLEERDVGRRLRRLSEILARELEVAAIGTQIQSQVQSELDKSQREYVLRQQLKAIQEELGERDPAEAEVDELREQLAAIRCPRTCAARPTASSRGWRSCPQAAAEHGVIRTYLEWIASLPWDTTTDGRPRPRATRARCSTPTTTTSRRSRTASSSSSPCASSSRTRAARSSASSARPASARRRSASRSPARSGASSCASAPAACATRPRSAGTAAPTSARCRARSSARCATRAPANPLFMIDEIDKLGADYRGDPAARDARGARPGAERDASATTTSTCRSTSRASCSSRPRTRSTRSPARCATAWR